MNILEKIDKTQVLAIIPARGGSKRIKDKNIKFFHGKPIISYIIQTAKTTGLFDEIMVSTDDKRIEKIALDEGVKVPFLRSSKNSNDFATTADVVLEVIKEYSSRGMNFDYVCCIYPTAPLLKPEFLIDSFSLLKKGDYDSIFPIAPFSYPIQRAIRKDNNNIRWFNSKYEVTRSQDLEVFYHDAGQFYWLNSKRFLVEKALLMNNSNGYLLDSIFVQDIDNLEDWDVAEFKYSFLNSKS